VEVMGSAEVAEFLGISRTRLVQLQRRADFPAPLAHLRAGLIWRGVDIRRWAAAHRPDRVPDDGDSTP
jgi:hypothetical protein